MSATSSPAAERAIDLLAGLNPPQRAAVTAADGPLLIFAGAGSGKTRVLTHRIAWLIQQGRAEPGEILAVTFTNKAAREMRSRVENLLNLAAGAIWMGTFHAIGVRILRRDGSADGIDRHFVIYDEADRLSVVKRVMTELRLDEKRYPPGGMVALISRAKDEVISADDQLKAAGTHNEELAAQIRMRYDAFLEQNNALDFDDLLMRTVWLFDRHPEVLEKYQKRFKYIMVDEYQDTNRAQYLMVRHLASKHRNLAVVGDDDQCLTEGTKITMADHTIKPIERVVPGDLVLSAFGGGDFRPARVARVHISDPPGVGIAITTRRGRRIVSTPQHTHFAGYRLSLSPQYYFTYLMRRSGVGYRLGTSQVHTRGQLKPRVGFMQRSTQEGADALWVISANKSENEARLHEYVLSLKYGIPTLPFMPRKGSRNGLVHDPDYLHRVFSAVDSQSGAERLIHDTGLSPSGPHYWARSRSGKRRNLVVTLCGDRRRKVAVHRIALEGSDVEGRHALESVGIKVKRARAGWRFETARSNYSEIVSLIQQVRQAFPVNVFLSARLGRNDNQARSANSLPFTPAAAVRRGMAMFDDRGGSDIVERVEWVPLESCVYDLDIENTHNYIAEGIVTHNSIYQFRGADVRNILSFEHDYPDAQIVKLEQNYRSTQMILDAAYHVIKANPNRADKRLWTDRPGGPKVVVAQTYDEQEEAQAVSREALRLVAEGDYRLGDIAILYRTNAQSRALEEVLLRRGVPYRLVGGLRFYERREVKDVLAYLRLIANPQDTLSFSRVINVPRRKLGEKSLAQLGYWADAHGMSAWDSLTRLPEMEELTPAAKVAFGDFRDLIVEVRAASQERRLVEVIDLLLLRSAYERYVREGSPEGDERWANVLELRGLASEYDGLSPGEGLQAFLEDVALMSDVDTMDDRAQGMTLITLHMVKGLEFPVVFMLGMEEGLFPHSRSLDSPSGLEEERRLAYVGMTRAKDRLYLFHAFRRHLFGSANLNLPSRFLKDIPPELVDGPAGIPSGMPDPTMAPARLIEAARPSAPVELVQRYTPGDHVEHRSWGRGTVLKSTMTRTDEEIIVKFDRVGMKILAVSLAPIAKV